MCIYFYSLLFVSMVKRSVEARSVECSEVHPRIHLLEIVGLCSSAYYEYYQIPASSNPDAGRNLRSFERKFTDYVPASTPKNTPRFHPEQRQDESDEYRPPSSQQVSRYTDYTSLPYRTPLTVFRSSSATISDNRNLVRPPGSIIPNTRGSSVSLSSTNRHCTKMIPHQLQTNPKTEFREISKKNPHCLVYATDEGSQEKPERWPLSLSDQKDRVVREETARLTPRQDQPSSNPGVIISPYMC